MSSSAVQQADANLWLAYAVKLKNALPQSPNLSSKSRFYVAPISAAGIAAGSRTATEFTNDGAYNVGDALLDLDEPVFLPTSQSYFQYCQSYCGSVALGSSNDMGAAVRYKEAQDNARDALNRFRGSREGAIGYYTKLSSRGLTYEPFASWVVQNYPQFAMAQSSKDRAMANLAASAGTVSDPNAALVAKYISTLTSADSLSPIPGYNMPCAPGPAGQIVFGRPGPPFQKPLYNVESQYAQTVDSWIATFAQNKNNPTKITFNPNDASNSSCNELGFDDDAKVTGSYCTFFSATFWENNNDVTKTVSAAEAGDELEITLTATGLGTFQIQPGQWNPSQLAGMPIVSNADQDLKNPKAHVATAVLAYGVGMQVTLSSSAYSTISNYLNQARKTGGRASVFGFNIGLGDSDNLTQTSTVTFDDVRNASSGNTITIPASDHSFPTLLAVIGESLPVPSN